jgi:tetratricopeptide (TPR) repeat protein
MNVRKLLSVLTISCQLIVLGSTASTGVEVKAQLRGIPLSCYVSVGAPSSSPGPLILMAEVTSEYWAEVALAYADAKQFDRAVGLFKRLDHDQIKKDTMLSIASKATVNGKYDLALKIVQGINDEDGAIEKAKGLAIIARQYASSGNQKQADRLFSQSEKYARKLKPEMSAMALSYVAVEYAAANRFQSALKIVQNLPPDDFSKFMALAGIVGEYAGKGKFDDSVRLARTINDDYHQSIAFSAIAKQATVSQLSQIQPIALAIKDDNYKVTALAAIAMRYVVKGQFQRASELEKTLVAIDPGSSAYYQLPGEYAKAGRFPSAIALVNQMQKGYWQDVAMASIASEYARVRQYDQGLKFADTIASAEGKNRAIQAIASEYGQSGQYDRAKVLLKGIKPVDDGDGLNIEGLNIKEHYIPLLECAQKGGKGYKGV